MESVITGESAPVNHEAGDMVLSGSKLLTACDAKVLRPLEESNLAQVQKAITQTLSRKSAFRSWMERFTNVYSPMVLISAVAVFLFGLLSGNTFSVAVYRSSVLLLIACPCSLLLASLQLSQQQYPHWRVKVFWLEIQMLWKNFRR